MSKKIAMPPQTGAQPRGQALAVPSSSPSSKLIPAAQWQAHHPWPPAGGLRHLIFNANSNGFSKVIRRVGRRVLIDEQAFFAWINQQGAAK